MTRSKTILIFFSLIISIGFIRSGGVDLNKITWTYDTDSLGIFIKKNGKGPLPQIGQKITVNYIGYFTNGTEFDNSFKKEAPFTFTTGTTMVIGGFENGLMKMNKGTKAYVKIPPALAYGATGGPNIPPNTTLIFYMELVRIE